MKNNISIKDEFLRKSIHLSNSGIAFLLFFWKQESVLAFVFIVTMLMIGLDLVRIYNSNINKIYHSFLGGITREFEKNRLTGASYVMLASLIVLLFFDKYTCIAALLIMSYSDTAAALIGRLYGKTQIFDKTLEGSFAFFTVSFLIILLLYPEIDFLFSFIAIIVATLVELFSLFKIDDNLSVPVVAAIIISLGG
ncbi:MAG: hypothetical protein CMG00_02415 [Candidatus Marinimicrobia bacterium]|nr:hypothetical protein [Candidatus Neomarinimicrobiota bacterium]